MLRPQRRQYLFDLVHGEDEEGSPKRRGGVKKHQKVDKFYGTMKTISQEIGEGAARPARPTYGRLTTTRDFFDKGHL